MDVFRIIWILIVEEIYDKFFYDNKLIMDQRLLKSLTELFQIWGLLYVEKSRPKFMELVKEFVLERLNVT